MSRYMSTRYSALDAYVPGEQPKDMQYIKLNTNESPYPPSPKVTEAVDSTQVNSLNLYPDPTCASLKDVLAEKFALKRENIFVSNGSDDILNFAFMAFAGCGGKAVFPDITYGFYEVFCQLHGIEYEKKPLKEDFSVDKADYLKNNALIAIANPNAPTGKLMSTGEIEEVVCKNPDNVVMIDEAYIDFGGESSIPLIKKYPNLLVVQTFSKSRSLAGARLGFAVAQPEIIADLEKIKYSTNPYSINRLSLTAGTMAIKSDSYYEEKCKEIIKTRSFTMQGLMELGFTLTDSYANFLFAKKENMSGEWFYKKLKENGILVRHFKGERICDYNRITIGTRGQMERFLEVTRFILREV